MGVSIQSEHEGQLDFYAKVLCRVDSTLTLDEVIYDRNDGVVNGTLLEFKKNAEDLSAALSQAIKYLSARRIKGKSVPAFITVVNLATETAYFYDTSDYMELVQQPYFGAASRGGLPFVDGLAKAKLRYGSNDDDASRLVSILKKKKFVRIDIDEDCIVGWAETFYETVPDATKEAFLGYEQKSGPSTHVGEIRNPTILRDYINPYHGETNVRFKHLFDYQSDRHCPKTCTIVVWADTGLITSQIDTAPKQAGIIRASLPSLITSQIDTAPKRER